MTTFKTYLRFFFTVEVFKNKIFDIMISFSSQKYQTFCHRSKSLQIFTFLCFSRVSFCFTPNFFKGVFKKNCGLGVLRYGLGPKQPRLVILCTYISGLGTKICSNELIFHAHIEEKINKKILFLKKNQFDQI